MRDTERVVIVEGPAGHTALLLDGETVYTDEDANKILDMAKDMEKSGDYKGREISVFWIFDTFPFYVDPWLKYPSLMRAYERGFDPFAGKTAEEAE
ncbi:MAG: hypothetical protein V3U09_04205 [Thermoplasmata archaeon]